MFLLYGQRSLIIKKYTDHTHACPNWIHKLDDQKTIIVFNNTNGTNLYEMSEQLYLVSTRRQPSTLKSPANGTKNN